MVEGDKMIEKLGGMEPIVIVLLILYVVIKDLVIPMYRKMSGKPVYKYNPHQPGTAPACIEHIQKLAGIETEITNIKEDIREIKDRIV